MIFVAKEFFLVKLKGQVRMEVCYFWSALKGAERGEEKKSPKPEADGGLYRLTIDILRPLEALRLTLVVKLWWIEEDTNESLSPLMPSTSPRSGPWSDVVRHCPRVADPLCVSHGVSTCALQAKKALTVPPIPCVVSEICFLARNTACRMIVGIGRKLQNPIFFWNTWFCDQNDQNFSDEPSQTEKF